MCLYHTDRGGKVWDQFYQRSEGNISHINVNNVQEIFDMQELILHVVIFIKSRLTDRQTVRQTS